MPAAINGRATDACASVGTATLTASTRPIRSATVAMTWVLLAAATSAARPA